MRIFLFDLNAHDAFRPGGGLTGETYKHSSYFYLNPVRFKSCSVLSADLFVYTRLTTKCIKMTKKVKTMLSSQVLNTQLGTYAIGGVVSKGMWLRVIKDSISSQGVTVRLSVREITCRPVCFCTWPQSWSKNSSHCNIHFSILKWLLSKELLV